MNNAPSAARRSPVVPLLVAASLLLAADRLPAQTISQLTDWKTGSNIPASISRDGLVCAFASSGNLTGANTGHAFQIFHLQVATNAVTQLTSDPAGGGLVASISDDAGRIAFVSRADPTGGNHDRSAELFVMNADGTSVRQLTAGTLGSVGSAAISGNGQRVVFSSSADPLGTNADLSQEVFLINWDGTGLRQLTASAGGSGGASISDDGLRIVFSSSQNLTGGNADLTSEVFAINADGTGLRQLTSSARSSTAARISGNGLKVVFQSNADLVAGGNTDLGDEVYLINWDGTGLLQLTSSGVGVSQAPSIDDAGGLIVFHSNQAVLFPPQNLDLNYEIWKINANKTGLTALTSSLSLESFGSFLPTLSGDGTRTAFISLSNLGGGNPDENGEIYTIRTDRTQQRQHTSTTWAFTGGPALTPDGARIAFTSSANLSGTDPGTNAELYRMQTDGSGLVKLTAASSGDAGSPSITGDGARIVFHSRANYAGLNPETNAEIFIINADGTGLQRLTNQTVATSENPRISRNGARIVFQSNGNLTGGNSDLSTEIFAINPDGTGLVQLTAAAAGSSTEPEIDRDGTLVVFRSTSDLLGTNPEGNAEIHAVRSDGTGLVQLTAAASGSSGGPDVSRDGQWAAFGSSADLDGSNADGNSELWVIGTNGSGLRRLTATSAGGSGGPAFADDGATITFSSSAPFFQPNPDGRTDLHQVNFDGTGLRRLTAAHFGGFAGPSPSGNGRRVVFSGLGDLTGSNPDLLPELWMVDLDAPWVLRASGTASTLLSWNALAGAWTYDAIRGNLASLAGAGAIIDLGVVDCLENDSPDTDTRGFEDLLTPAPGQGFFYLVRSFDGTSASGYGSGSDGRPRVPLSGDCSP